MSSLNDAFWNEKEEGKGWLIHLNATLLLTFKKDIKAAIHTLGSAGLPISINKACEQLADCIIDSYDNATSLFAYKTA